MRKISIMLVIVMLMCIMPTYAEGTEYTQAPMLDEAVANGTLPPVEERLPLEPEIYDDYEHAYLTPEQGNYGGTMRFVTSAVNWDADVFLMMTEFMVTLDLSTNEVRDNVVKYEVSEDNTVFTFTLREGMKWSDGEPVTMEDVEFFWNNILLNEELTPVVGANYRSGGSATANVMKFEVIDDWTYRVTSEVPYGGYLLTLSYKGWPGYDDYIRPAHYLKPFHPDFAEEYHGSLEAFYEYIRPFAEAIGYDDPTAEGVWTYVFNQIDMTHWELTDPNDALTTKMFPGLIDNNFPVLYPWVMEDSDGGLTTWVRNPYFYKVDQWGQQLPYIDRVTSKFVESMELVQLEIVSGDIDIARESATTDNIPLYKEAESKGVTTHVVDATGYPIALFFNFNYDGDESFVEAMQYVDFRKAMGYAIDSAEILDSVYNGFGGISRQSYVAEYNPELAIDMLDEMGFVDADGDGWRETPTGKTIQWFIYVTPAASDMIPTAELLMEYFHEIGLNIGVQTLEQSYYSTAAGADELPMRIHWMCETGTWQFLDLGQNALGNAWHTWYTNGGLAAEEGAEIAGVEPLEEVKELYRLGEAMMSENPTVVGNEIVPAYRELVDENAFYLLAVNRNKMCAVINSDYGNIPETASDNCSYNLFFEFFFDKSAAE